MKLLLLGSGGREHALAWKIAQSPKIEKLYIAPGNAGTRNVGENIAIKADDFEAIKTFVIENNNDMVVVGPEDPLVKGIYDFFKNDESLKNIEITPLSCFKVFSGYPFALNSPLMFLPEPPIPVPSGSPPCIIKSTMTLWKVSPS